MGASRVGFLMNELIQALDQSSFNYQQLDSETRTFVKYRTVRIKILMGRTAQDIVEIGEKLIQVKERLGHGKFGAWLESEFGWSDRTARRYMMVAEHFKSDTVSDLSIQAKALYLLASPSTPDEIRQDFIEQAQNGAAVTYSNVKAALDEAPINQDAPICPECGQVYDGDGCPDCQHQNGYNYKRDNRRSVASDIYVPQGMDACQTPAYALDPLLPYLPREWVIWEPACGEGLLVEALYDSGYRENQVVSSDILSGQNFFEYEPDNWDCLITNPPFSIKDKWLKRCYELGKPFALILPAEIPGTAYAAVLFEKFGVEIIYVRPRINFKMPNKGFGGGGSQFPTAWFTYGLNIGQQMTFAKVAPDAD